MLSRRNIRVKVMQTLYAANRDQGLTTKEAVKAYREQIQQSFGLYLFNLLQLQEITKYSIQDEQSRKSKHLPSDEDRQFTTKLYHNELIQSFLDNTSWANLVKEFNLKDFLTDDNTRLLYMDFLKTPEYNNCLLYTSPSPRDQRGSRMPSSA